MLTYALSFEVLGLLPLHYFIELANSRLDWSALVDHEVVSDGGLGHLQCYLLYHAWSRQFFVVPMFFRVTHLSFELMQTRIQLFFDLLFTAWSD